MGSGWSGYHLRRALVGTNTALPEASLDVDVFTHIGAQWQLPHGEQDLQRPSKEAGILDTLDFTFPLEQTLPLGKPGSNFRELDLVAMAFVSQDICVYPGAGPQPTCPLMGAQICL